MALWTDRKGLFKQEKSGETRVSYPLEPIKERKEGKIMDLVKDIVDKYSTEQIIAYLDKLMGGVLKNYQTAIKVNQPEVLFGDLGDIAQVKSVLHEMNKRNAEREAVKQNMV